MNELETIWKEEVVDYFELLSFLWPEGVTKKTMKNLSNEVEI
jgi:hypothetical protein